MTPLELCEPLFTKVCLLNRLGRQGGGVAGYDQLRLEIEEIFAEIGKAADGDPAVVGIAVALPELAGAAMGQK